MKTRNFMECGDFSPPLRGAHSEGWPKVGTGRRPVRADASARRPYLATLLLMLTALCARAQYSLAWSTIAGGGGTSTGGVYAVSGTIGQPDASALSGGNYTMQGGFWSIIAVPTPGAPTLSIFRTPTNTVVISWPSPSTGWQLQQNTNLNTVNWTTPPETVTDNGTEKFILINPPAGNRFYRLHQP